MLNSISLKSETSKRETLKEQIKMRVVGFGWKDLSCAWFRDGKARSFEALLEHLVDTIIPE